MFLECDISPMNKPRDARLITIPIVDPYQIHKESAKINYKKLNSVLSDLGVQDDNSIHNIPDFLQTTLTSMIVNANTSEEDKSSLRDNLERIMNERLNWVNYEELNPEFKKTVIKMVNYTNNQPDKSLKTEYVKTFVEDCITAYDGSDGMTCSMGALERIFFSFVTAASVVNPNKDEWKEIINCIVENTKDLVDGYIKEWYKLHKKDSAGDFKQVMIEEKMTEEEMTEEEMTEYKRKNLRDFLIKQLPNELVLINERIIEVADNIGYKDDDFAYGGKKLLRRSATTRNRRKRKHTRKIIRQKNKKSFCVKSTNKKKL
jgi:hypothetical protein